MEFVKDFFVSVYNKFTMIGIKDIFDIIIVTFIFYYTFKFLRDRRAGKLAFGVVLLLGLMLLSDVFEMNALNFILTNIFQVGLIAIIIVFQPELRSALEKVGGSSLSKINKRFVSQNISEINKVIDEICKSCESLSASKTGALIVIERDTKIGDVINSGTVIDAEVSSFLLNNIFFNKAPLHDGAVIVRNFRIFAAGCLLPLSSNEDIIKDLGTRHRAAIGMSENSDAAVIVVSEETGTVSVALDGKLKRGFNRKSLNGYLK
ncbi:MAG: diadenylate cyclase CdaA, partial [Clostridia bacterium]|nr:diadenylate cyclase CdaA [Clostridia bacterium]